MIGKGLREKANAIAEIPSQVKTMTAIVIGIGLLSILAFAMSLMAVRRAD